MPLFQSTQANFSKPKLVSMLAIATIAAVVNGCGGRTSDDAVLASPLVSIIPPDIAPIGTTFSVKDAELLYTTATPISIGQLQAGLASRQSALPLFVDGRNSGARTGLMAGLAANSSAFNLVSVGKDGISRQTIESAYLNRVLYTVNPPNFNTLTWQNLNDPNVYIAFSSDPFSGDANNYSEFIVKNGKEPCALYYVNTNNNIPGCVLPNVEPIPFFNKEKDWGLFDGSSRKPLQFDAEGNIYVVGYPFKVSNGQVVKETNTRLYRIEHDSYIARPLTQDNESVAFFALFPSGEPVVALHKQTGMDLVLFKANGNTDQRLTIEQGISTPFVNVDTYRTLIYGGASGSKGINLVRVGNVGMERASIDYTTGSGSIFSFDNQGQTYANPTPRRVISGDDGKYYTVYSADASAGSVLLVYQTLPFKSEAVAVIPVTGDWWNWMKSRPIQIKRGILYYAETIEVPNIGKVDTIKIVRLRDGTTQTLFANSQYRIDGWKALGDTLYFSGIDNDRNQVIQGQVNTKRIAQQNDWSAGVWKNFTPYTVKATASAAAANIQIQDMENLLPQQPKDDPGMSPQVSAFESTDKAAYLSFTKYMNMAEVERLLDIAPEVGATAKPGVFPLWGYQTLHLIFDNSNGLADTVTKGLAPGSGSYYISSLDKSLPDAYGWSVPKIKYKVEEKNGSFAKAELVGVGISTQPLDQTVRDGAPVTFAVTATGTQLSYQWMRNGRPIEGATQSSYTLPATSAADSGALFAVIVTNAIGSVTSNFVTLAVLSAPGIETHPLALSVSEGQVARFAVVATGTAPLRYQWKKNGADIADANSSSYTTPATSIADNGAEYLVVVGNEVGSASSSPARLTVIPAVVAPAFTSLPGNQTVNAGQTATFQVTASGTAPINYQWKKNGSNISGANSSSYTTPVTSSADNGAVFTVNVSNSAGTVASTNATLTVNIGPSITTQPAASQTITAGQTVSFGVVASGTAPLSYQWKKNGSNIAGATSSTYTTPAMAVADSGAVFTVEISNMAGTVSSNSATVTVNPVAVAPAITAQPGSVSVTAGQTATFSVTASGTAPLSYQWKKGGSNIAGATSSSYTTPATSSGDNGAVFTVIVSNSAGTATSSNATLTVNVVPTISTQPASQTVTAGQTVSFGVVATGTAPLSYQWRKNGSNISGATSSTYTTPATVDGDNGAVFTVVISNVAGSITSSNATVTVNPAPVAPAITAQPGSLSVTAGQTASFSVTASGTAPLSYQWRKNGSNIPGANSSSYTTPVTSSADNGGVYSVVVSNSGGIVNSSGATLSVSSANATPVVTPAVVSMANAEAGTQNVNIRGSGFSAGSWYQTTTDGNTWSNGVTAPVFNSDSELTVPVSKTRPEGTLLRIRVCSSSGANASCSSEYVTVRVGAVAVSALRYSTVQSYTKEECVKDDVTGLIWEGKPSTGDRASTITFTNYDANYSGGTDINAGSNSIGYVNKINARALCGFSDWRMPTVTELASIVDYSNSNPTINASWFPNTVGRMHWSSTQSTNPEGAWGVNFDVGTAFEWNSRGAFYRIRLVRTSSASVLPIIVIPARESGTQSISISGSGFSASSSYQISTNHSAWSNGAAGTLTYISSTAIRVNTNLQVGAFVRLRVCGNANDNGTCSRNHVIVHIGNTSSSTISSGNRYKAVDNYSTGECIQDADTGLVWEVKTNSGTRAHTNTYTNYDSTTTAQKPDDTVPTQAEIVASTNSIGYKNAVNGLALCGFTDWRLPTSIELYGLGYTSNSSTVINTMWFPYLQNKLIWSSSPAFNYVNQSQVEMPKSACFLNWSALYWWCDTQTRSTSSPVVLVRSGNATPAAPVVNPASVDVIRAASGTQAVSISGSGFSASSVYQISNNHGTWTNGTAGSFTFNSANSVSVAVDKTLAEGTFLRLRVCSISSDNTSCSSDYVAVNIGNTQSSGNRYSAVVSYSKECVKDNATGLIWEGKTTSGSRSSAVGFTNYDSTTSAQKWNNSNPTQAEIDASTNSIGYKNMVNSSALCGYTDWRLPTKEELQTIIDSSRVSPAINSTWFPNTVVPALLLGPVYFYWSSSPITDDPRFAWGANFYNGNVENGGGRGGNLAVRLVRSSL